jgi:hypothetical protein
MHDTQKHLKNVYTENLKTLQSFSDWFTNYIKQNSNQLSVRETKACCPNQVMESLIHVVLHKKHTCASVLLILEDCILSLSGL